MKYVTWWFSEVPPFYAITLLFHRFIRHQLRGAHLWGQLLWFTRYECSLLLMLMHFCVYLYAIHFEEWPSVFFMVLGMSEIPAVLVQNSKTVMWQTISHKISVQVAIPFDGDGNHTALNGHSVKKIVKNYIYCNFKIFVDKPY